MGHAGLGHPNLPPEDPPPQTPGPRNRAHLQAQGVHDCCQHADIISSGALDAVPRASAPEVVAAPHHDANLEVWCAQEEGAKCMRGGGRLEGARCCVGELVLGMHVRVC